MSDYFSRLRQQTGLMTPMVTTQNVSDTSTQQPENALEITPDTSDTEAFNGQPEAFNTTPRLDRGNLSTAAPPAPTASNPLSSPPQETPRQPSQIISTPFQEQPTGHSNDWTAATVLTQPAAAQPADDFDLSQPISPSEPSKKTPHQEHQSSNPIHVSQRDLVENTPLGDEQWILENQQVGPSDSERLRTESKDKPSEQTPLSTSNTPIESTQSAYLKAFEAVRDWVAQPIQPNSAASSIATETLTETAPIAENANNRKETAALSASPKRHQLNLPQDHLPRFPSRPQPQADNTVISIGSIQVTVEAPPEQTQTPKAQPLPQKLAAAPVRLSRHYLRL